ncbi:MAG: phospholipase D-like domain-containing protein, partial [Blastocatellia bacterium]
ECALWTWKYGVAIGGLMDVFTAVDFKGADFMNGRALAIANNDIVYLYWTYPERIAGCLGFSIHRLVEGKPAAPLPAFAGFDKAGTDALDKAKHNTDFLPVQSFQWKDVFVPEETDVTYEIIPVGGTPGKKLKEIPGFRLMTNVVRATDQLGGHRVVFNRGIISTQALARKLKQLDNGAMSENALRKHIGEIGDPIRAGLAGEAIEALTSLLDRARTEGGKCFMALYELADRELIEAIKANRDHLELILSNADGSVTVAGKQQKVYDKTNADTRKDLHKLLSARMHDRLLAKGNAIGHNKFVVYVDKAGKPQAVLTGSTNWTSTGICSQSNNILILEDTKIAARYLDYWKRILQDDAAQGADFRADNAMPPPDLSPGPGAGKVRIWFSPNTKQKTKPANPDTPADLAEVFAAISGAKHGVLFLLFNAGAPSILTRIDEESRKRQKAKQEFFVRGAVSNAQTSKQFATRVYNDSLLKAPNTLITGIAGIRDAFSFWEREMEKLGHAVIHDKIVVIDPFSPDCVVVTGSHNLGFKASFSNDENLLIIRGNQDIARAYAAHVLDVVNHYNWRFKLAQAKLSGATKQAFQDLDEQDTWQDKYFRKNFLASRDLFFFP